jgi:UDPglucose 6-dehydrogenase
MHKICVIGAGYVGATTAILFASLGNLVRVCEINPERIELLQHGKLPIFEPELEGHLSEALERKLLMFTSNLEDAATGSDFIFICVPTPSLEDGSADLSFVLDTAKKLSLVAKSGAIIITKSTVPVGSAEEITAVLGREDLHVVSNPEFLREGSAVEDFFNPDRIVIGATERSAAEAVANLYAQIETKVMITDPKSSELIKYASNSFLAMKLSFVNEIARLCDTLGASSKDVIFGFGLDNRIGPKFTKPGPGWGGSCFPKDARALSTLARSNEINLQMVDAAIASNLNAKLYVVKLLRKALGGQLSGKKIAVWGLAFKAFTDDIRESPAVDIIELLLEQGCLVSAYDPQVQNIGFGQVELSSSAKAATLDADALLVLTEWPEFAEENPSQIIKHMRGNAVVDTRSLLNARNWSISGADLKVLGNLNSQDLRS